MNTNEDFDLKAENARVERDAEQFYIATANRLCFKYIPWKELGPEATGFWRAKSEQSTTDFGAIRKRQQWDGTRPE